YGNCCLPKVDRGIGYGNGRPVLVGVNIVKKRAVSVCNFSGKTLRPDYFIRRGEIESQKR
ncbi:MAG: hypothetical protein UW47_C0007G0033, partial [Candidatus Woesebacteria bacterium GW2011_GWA1_44_23]